MFKDIDHDFLAKIRGRVPDFSAEANTGLPKGSLRCGNGLLAAELGHIWSLELGLFLSTGLKIFNEPQEFGDFFTQSHWPIICLGDNHSNQNVFPKNKPLLVEGFVWPVALAFCRADSMSNTRLLFYRTGVEGQSEGSAPDPILYYQGELGANLAADFLAAYYNRVLMSVLMRPNQMRHKRRLV